MSKRYSSCVERQNHVTNILLKTRYSRFCAQIMFARKNHVTTDLHLHGLPVQNMLVTLFCPAIFDVDTWFCRSYYVKYDCHGNQYMLAFNFKHICAKHVTWFCHVTPDVSNHYSHLTRVFSGATRETYLGNMMQSPCMFTGIAITEFTMIIKKIFLATIRFMNVTGRFG